MSNPLETRGSTGGRARRQLRPAPVVDTRSSNVSLKTQARPVNGGTASPVSAASDLTEVARALGAFNPALKTMAANNDKVEAARGANAYATGEFRELSEVQSESEAYREAFAGAAGEALGFKATSQLEQIIRDEGDQPGFDVDAAIIRVSNEYLGDINDPDDATMNENALHQFRSRAASMRGAHITDVRNKLLDEGTQIHLSNLGEKIRSLASIPDPLTRNVAAQEEFQSALADARKLHIDPAKIQEQRINKMEELAIATGDVSIFDGANEPDEISGTALIDHRVFGPKVANARARAQSSINDRNAAANNVLKMKLIERDDAAADKPYSLTRQEVEARAALLPSDPRHISASRGASLLKTQREANAGEEMVRANVARITQGIPTEGDSNKDLYAATKRLSRSILDQGGTPEMAMQRTIQAFVSEGRIPSEFKKDVEAQIYSSQPAQSTAAMNTYRAMFKLRPDMAAHLFTEGARTRVRAWEGLNRAGVDEGTIAELLSKAANKFPERAGTLNSNKENYRAMNAALEELGVDDSTSNYFAVKDKLTDTVAAMMSAYDIPAATAIAAGTAILKQQLVAIPGNDNGSLYDRGDIPFGLTDPELNATFRSTYIRGAIRNSYLGSTPPYDESDVEIRPLSNGTHVMLVYPNGTGSRPINYMEFERTARKRLNAQSDNAYSSDDAVTDNATLQEQRSGAAETEQGGPLYMKNLQYGAF